MEFDYRKQPGLKKWNRDLVTDGEPLVTIVTPYYNGAEYIEQTFNCVINQTFPWFEWIIVNDGSTRQEDVKFVEKLAKRDPRVRVVHKENGGISTARNFGMKQAKTKYVMSLDCDDLIEPTYIEYCWWMLEKNPKASWAYTDSVGFQNQEYTWKKPFDPILLKTENHLTEVAFFRKEVIDEMGGYAEVAKHYNEDWYLYLRMVATGHFPVQSKNDFLSWYRRRDNGVLAIVEEQSQESDFNKQLIESMADKIISPKHAKIFPTGNSNFEKPNFTDWTKSIYKKHDKIHVTLITSWLEMGGADKFNLDLLAGLDKEKFEVSILTTVPNEEEPWQQRFREATPDVFNLPNFMEPKDYAEFISYFLTSRETDILFVTNTYHGYYMLPWLRMHFPKLAIVDYVHMEEWYWRKGGYARTSSVLRNILEKTYVCNSATREVMIKKFDCSPDSVETVHIGVDPDYYDNRYVQKGLVREQLNIANGRPIVLFICRLHPQKRPLMMLEIADRVRKQIPDVAFVVVGNGGMEEEVRRVASAKQLLNTTVYFTGSQIEVRPYYQDADLTLICSIKEGLALTAYESCAMGVPVISSDVGGQKDLIDDEVGALIPCIQKEDKNFDAKVFPEEELKQYVDVIAKYLKNDVARLEAGRACRERIEKEFSIDCMVEHFEKEFQELMSSDVSVDREEMSSALCVIAPIIEDYITIEIQEQQAEDGRSYYSGETIKERISSHNAGGLYLDYDLEARLHSIELSLQNHEEVVNRHEEVVNRHEEVVNRHEEVVNRHEEAINCHEEVVNRHEQVVNDDWAWLKNLEHRVGEIENSKQKKLWR